MIMNRVKTSFGEHKYKYSIILKYVWNIDTGWYMINFSINPYGYLITRPTCVNIPEHTPYFFNVFIFSGDLYETVICKDFPQHDSCLITYWIFSVSMILCCYLGTILFSLFIISTNIWGSPYLLQFLKLVEIKLIYIIQQ
jgi:hypothetical protein